MLAHRLRRRPNIEPTLDQRLVFTGTCEWLLSNWAHDVVATLNQIDVDSMSQQRCVPCGLYVNGEDIIIVTPWLHTVNVWMGRLWLFRRT